jgi:hypothetical protein
VSSCTRQTLKVNPIVCTTCVVEESAEDLRSKSQSDYPKFNGSESPDKTIGSESRNIPTEFISTRELAGPPIPKTKHHIETEDMSHSQDIIVDSGPKKRSVNSDPMMLGNPFKKLFKNDTYLSQKKDTPSCRQFPSWTAFGSNPNHHSSLTLFSTLTYEKRNPDSSTSTPIISPPSPQKPQALIPTQATLPVTSNPMIRLSLMAQENDFFEFRTIKDLLEH